jgi:hypothetical protein
LGLSSVHRRHTRIRESLTLFSGAAIEAEKTGHPISWPVKDLYSAEKQLVKALPKMARAATNEQLSEGFEEHLEQTEVHV